MTDVIEGLVIAGVPSYDASDDVWNIGVDKWRREYVSIKYTLAKMLNPKRICEIGVYSGISACCFLAACPEAEYVGIDNLYEERSRGLRIVEETRHLLASVLGYKASVLIADSQSMSELPGGSYDLVHVDADHSRYGAKHDTLLAWKALTPVGAVLVDNGHDANVCAGVFDAMNEVADGKLLNWKYFPESVGNILIYKEAV